MNKIKLNLEFNGYEFSVLGLVSNSGHVEALRISPIGFEMSEIDSNEIQEIHDLAQEILLEKFYCPEMEFDL